MAEVTGGGTTMARAAALVFCALIAGCGGGGGGGDSGGGNQVQITPGTATVPAGGRMPFSGPSGSAAWSVENIPGGSSSVGTVSPTGLYLAPVRVPSLNTVADPNGTAGVTISVPGAANPAAVTLVSRFEVSSVDVCAGPNCPLTDSPNAIALADLNNDIRSDIVTGNTASGTISVLLSTGASTFAPPDRYDIGDPSKLPEPQALVATPVDNADTLVDIVIADASLQEPAVRTHLGNGDGTLQTGMAQILPGQNYPLAMASGQFNSADAFPDVVVTNFLANRVMTLLGSPTGQFQAPTEVLTSPQVSGPLGVAAGDFNHDGSDDIVVASSANAQIVVGINDRNGAFPSPKSYPIPGSPSAVAAADLNSDTYLDLLVTDAVGNTLTVLLNRGAAAPGMFQSATELATGWEPVAVAAADFNGDGAVDAAVVNRHGGTVTTYFGHNDGTLTPAETYRVGSDPRAVAVGDVDGNGWFDLAVVNSGDDTVSVLRNRGAPTTP